MENIKQQILEIKAEYGDKHFARKISNTPELFEYVQHCIGNSFSEKIYNFLYPDEHTCELGNRKTFNSINYGYRFCGRAKTCECARNSVSISVTTAKSLVTPEQQAIANQKRVETCLQLYGVTNNGQTEKAILAHKAFYSDKKLVEAVNRRIKETKLRNHGNENYNNSEQTKQWWKDRQPSYWVDRYNNEKYLILYNKEEMESLIKQYSPGEIADQIDVHVQTIYRHLNLLGLRDPYQSSAEKEVVGFLESIGITNITCRSRKIISKELDIYLPDYKIAIEYDGIFWHHEDIPHIDKNYHQDKYARCKDKGIQLITIFSNFWRYKKPVVKKLLINKLGINQEKIHARKCEVRKITNIEAKPFLNDNHVQGHVNSGFLYALFFKDQMVAVMTFGKPNMTGGCKDEKGIDLKRYASSTRVVGGAGKLLAAFIKDEDPVRIYSYSNNEWSHGNLYQQLGFTLEREVPPSYWYVYPREEKLIHRSRYMKHKLVNMGYDKDSTEQEITKEMGLLKVWDCGKKRWGLNRR